MATGLNPYNRSLSSRSCSLTSKQRTHKFLALLSPIGPLHLSRTLYKSHLFMQNKANFLDALMNVTSLITVDSENKSNWTLGENKANTKPIKANLLDAQMNVNLTLTKGYRKNGDFTVRINKPNLVRRRRIANERKLNFNKGLQKKR